VDLGKSFIDVYRGLNFGKYLDWLRICKQSLFLQKIQFL
jgi:hypothetical protein